MFISLVLLKQYFGSLCFLIFKLELTPHDLPAQGCDERNNRRLHPCIQLFSKLTLNPLSASSGVIISH